MLTSPGERETCVSVHEGRCQRAAAAQAWEAHPCVSMCGCCNYRSRLPGLPPAGHSGTQVKARPAHGGTGQPEAFCFSYFWERSQFSSHYPSLRKGLLFLTPSCGSRVRTLRCPNGLPAQTLEERLRFSTRDSIGTIFPVTQARLTCILTGGLSCPWPAFFPLSTRAFLEYASRAPHSQLRWFKGRKRVIPDPDLQ